MRTLARARTRDANRLAIFTVVAFFAAASLDLNRVARVAPSSPRVRAVVIVRVPIARARPITPTDVAIARAFVRSTPPSFAPSPRPRTRCARRTLVAAVARRRRQPRWIADIAFEAHIVESSLVDGIPIVSSTQHPRRRRSRSSDLARAPLAIDRDRARDRSIETVIDRSIVIHGRDRPVARRPSPVGRRAGRHPRPTRGPMPRALSECVVRTEAMAKTRARDGVETAPPSPTTPHDASFPGAASSSDSDASDGAADVSRCVREMLRAMGEDVEREGLMDTPTRVAKALAFAMRGYDACPTAALGTALFNEDGLARASSASTKEDIELGTNDVVLVRDIPVFSTCARTFMPFYGVIHVGYAPRAGVIVGLSKLARVAEVYSRRLQTPDGLARAVAQALDDVASPLGVGVMFTGMQLGPFEPRKMEGWASTGCFAATNSVWWDEFSALVELGGGPSELSRGIWGDESRCGSCDNVQGGKVATTRGETETMMDAAASRAASEVDESVFSSVSKLLRALNLEKRVSEATDGEVTLEDTAKRYSQLLAAMRSGADVPFNLIAESATRDGESNDGVDEIEDGVCVTRDLHMSTVCEHHLLPFHGTVSAAYMTGPGAQPLSRDTLQAIVSRHSRRLQVQERLTRDIAEEISTLTGGVGVIVAARASHLCMVSRGVEKPGSSTCTAVKLGQFAREPALRARAWKRLCATGNL